MALLSSTTGSLTGSMTGPILGWGPKPGLKYDEERTNLALKLKQTRPNDWLLELPCAVKNGGGLLKEGTMKKQRYLAAYPRSGSTWMRAMIMNIFGLFANSFEGNIIVVIVHFLHLKTELLISDNVLFSLQTKQTY